MAASDMPKMPATAAEYCSVADTDDLVYRLVKLRERRYLDDIELKKLRNELFYRLGEKTVLVTRRYCIELTRFDRPEAVRPAATLTRLNVKSIGDPQCE